jgi:hypothetical protein
MLLGVVSSPSSSIGELAWGKVGVQPEVALVAAPPRRLRQIPSEAEDGISRAEDPIEIQIQIQIQIEANTDVVRGTTRQRRCCRCIRLSLCNPIA